MHARTHTHTHTSFCLSFCYILLLLTPCILCTLFFTVPIKSKDVTCLCKLTCLSLSLSLSASERMCLLPHMPKGSLIGCSTVSLCCCVLLRDLCSLYRQDQEVCATVLLGLLPAIQCLGQTQHPANEMRHVQGVLLQVMSGFW